MTSVSVTLPGFSGYPMQEEVIGKVMMSVSL